MIALEDELADGIKSYNPLAVFKNPKQPDKPTERTDLIRECAVDEE